MSGLDFSELFLQQRAQLQLSTSICVPHLEGIRDVLGVPSLVPHMNLRLRLPSAWGPPFPAVGSEALMFSEMSPQPGASYGSPRQFYLDGVRDVSKALFQLWLFTEAMFQQWLSSQLGSQVSIFHVTLNR